MPFKAIGCPVIMPHRVCCTCNCRPLCRWKYSSYVAPVYNRISYPTLA